MIGIKGKIMEICTFTNQAELEALKPIVTELEKLWETGTCTMALSISVSHALRDMKLSSLRNVETLADAYPGPFIKALKIWGEEALKLETSGPVPSKG